MNEDKYYEIVNSNYDKVFKHFAEQDRLRNEALNFFAAISGVIIGFGNKSFELLLANFILGVFFSVLLCRYKYYGNLYSATMKILRFLSVDIKNQDNDKMQQILNKYSSEIHFNVFSADFLIYECLILINTTILFILLSKIVFYKSLIICLFYFFVLSSLEFYLLVIRNTKNLQLKDLSFIDIFIKN